MTTTFEKLIERSAYKEGFYNNKPLPKEFYKYPLCNIQKDLYQPTDTITIDNDTYQRCNNAIEQQNELNYPIKNAFDFSFVTPEQNKKIWDWLQSWHLKNPISVLHNQKPGQTHPFHMDLINSYLRLAPKYYNTEIPVFENENDVFIALKNKLRRVFIFLEDWIPGQVVMLGTKVITEWHSGDVLWFDWYHVPHGTANFSRQNRMMLQVTGETTPEFEELIRS